MRLHALVEGVVLYEPCVRCSKEVYYTTKGSLRRAQSNGVTCRACLNTIRWEKKQEELDLSLPRYTCGNCGLELRADAFSVHSETRSGYDTSSCKICKKSSFDWSKVPMEKRIYQRIKSRAKRDNLEFDLELTDIVIPTHCPVFGVKLVYGDKDWTYSVDRLDPSKGYVKGNVSIISNKANRTKNNATLQDLEAICSWLRTMRG